MAAARMFWWRGGGQGSVVLGSFIDIFLMLPPLLLRTYPRRWIWLLPHFTDQEDCVPLGCTARQAQNRAVNPGLLGCFLTPHRGHLSHRDSEIPALEACADTPCTYKARQGVY